jgi:hypothetical protein
LRIKQVHAALKKNERKEKVPTPSEKMQEHIDLHSSLANEESTDENNSLILPFEGTLKEKGDKKDIECLEVNKTLGTQKEEVK